MPDLTDALTDAVVSALAAGPAGTDELLARIRAEGVDTGPEPEETIDEIAASSTRIYVLSDERMIDLLTVMDGLTFTVPIADTLDREGSIWEHHWTDLCPVWWMAAAELPLTVDGAHTGLVTGPDLLHEGRWLDRVVEDVLTGFRLRNGSLDVVATVDPPPAVTPGIREVFRRLAELIEEHRAPAEVDPFVFEMLVDSRSAVPALLPPITELAASAGLEVDDGYLVTRGWDWDHWMDDQTTIPPPETTDGDD